MVPSPTGGRVGHGGCDSIRGFLVVPMTRGEHPLPSSNGSLPRCCFEQKFGEVGVTLLVDAQTVGLRPARSAATASRQAHSDHQATQRFSSSARRMSSSSAMPRLVAVSPSRTMLNLSFELSSRASLSWSSWERRRAAFATALRTGAGSNKDIRRNHSDTNRGKGWRLPGHSGAVTGVYTGHWGTTDSVSLRQNYCPGGGPRLWTACGRVVAVADACGRTGGVRA
jgi:hypothetical protein